MTVSVSTIAPVPVQPSSAPAGSTRVGSDVKRFDAPQSQAVPNAGSSAIPSRTDAASNAGPNTGANSGQDTVTISAAAQSASQQSAASQAQFNAR